MSEKIGVFLQFDEYGEIQCLCKWGRKKCDNWCEKGFVYYDRYHGWRSTYSNDRYGKWKNGKEGGREDEP